MPRKRDPSKPIGPTPLVLEGEAKAAAMDHICEQIAAGVTLRDIGRQPGMPKPRTVSDWMAADPEFMERMEAARQVGYDAIAEEALEIADTPMEGVEFEIGADGTTKEKRGDMLGHRKLQVETRLKLLAKWHPKKYGDKVTNEHTGPNGGPVILQTTPTDEAL